MRRLLKPLWIFFALVFVFEAWLWERLQPVVARIVAFLPFDAVRRWLAAVVEKWPPPALLVVFALPLFVMFLIETAVLWLVANYWLLVLAVLVMAKLAGVGVTAFLFDATKPKLLQMAWFRWCYEKILAGLAWAHALADPYVAQVKAAIAKLRGNGEVWRMIRLIRERVRRARSA